MDLITLNSNQLACTFTNSITDIIALLTLIAFVGTLSSQIYTQRMQTKINKMESARFKSEIPITLKSSELNHDGVPSQDGIANRFKIENISSETVYDLNFSTIEGYWNIQQPPFGVRAQMESKEFQMVLLAKKEYSKIKSIENSVNKCTIEITYQDIRGVKYKHSIGYDAKAIGYEGRRATYLWDKKIERLPD